MKSHILMLSSALFLITNIGAQNHGKELEMSVQSRFSRPDAGMILGGVPNFTPTKLDGVVASGDGGLFGLQELNADSVLMRPAKADIKMFEDVIVSEIE